MWQSIKDKLSAWYEAAKVWFKRSETILWARLQVIAGFAIGGFSAVDWTQVTINLSQSANSLKLAAGLIINGLFTEYLRRRNASLPSS